MTATKFKILDEEEIKRQIIQSAKKGHIQSSTGYTYPIKYVVDIGTETQDQSRDTLFAQVVVHIRHLDFGISYPYFYVEYNARIPPIREHLSFNRHDGIKESRKRYDVDDLFADSV